MVSEIKLPSNRKRSQRSDKIVLTPEQIKSIEMMAGLGLNYKEMSYILGFSRATLERRFEEDPELREVVQKGRAKVKKGLVGKAYQEAMNGNTPLLIFLLKTRYGFREKVDVEHSGNVNVSHEHRLMKDIENMSDEELESKIKELRVIDCKVVGEG